MLVTYADVPAFDTSVKLPGGVALPLDELSKFSWKLTTNAAWRVLVLRAQKIGRKYLGTDGMGVFMVNSMK